jgi:WD40 repeat protein
MPLKAPSRVEPTTIPIFALKWHSSPAILPSHILAYAGGGGSARTGIGNTIKINVDTQTITIDTGVEIGVALDILVTQSALIYVAIGISDSVKIYLIDLEQSEAVLAGTIDFEKGAGVNAVAWNAYADTIVAGCENGKVCIAEVHFENDTCIKLTKTFELEGHIKAVCSCAFHPRNSGVLMTSAKDGTCRVWNLGIDGEDKCMKVLDCKIYDPKGPKPIEKILNPKPGQCLVRGCAFGDLEGRVIYTIQSGRKGGAYLTVWRLIRKPVLGETVTPPNDPNGPPQPKFVFDFEETMRKQVSKYPVSAMSLSGDYSTLALGDTDGSITLLSTEKFKKIKFWECAHDLPVTCIAARPLPVPLAGEELTGVAVDAISASADNKICHVTKQRKSTLKPKRKEKKNAKMRLGAFYPIYVILFAIMVYAAKVSFDVCHGEFVGMDDIVGVTQCVLHTVLWTASDRPGIAFVPH